MEAVSAAAAAGREREAAPSGGAEPVAAARAEAQVAAAGKVPPEDQLVVRADREVVPTVDQRQEAGDRVLAVTVAARGPLVAEIAVEAGAPAGLRARAEEEDRWPTAAPPAGKLGKATRMRQNNPSRAFKPRKSFSYAR